MKRRMRTAALTAVFCLGMSLGTAAQTPPEIVGHPVEFLYDGPWMTISSTREPFHVIRNIDAWFESHLRTGLTVRGANGAQYHLSVLSSRLGTPGENTAYLAFHREGMGEPFMVDIRKIKRSFGPFGAGGSIKKVVVDGQTFEVHLKAAMSSRNSHLRVWPEERKDEMVDLTIAEYFARTGRAGYGWEVPSSDSPGEFVEVASVYYRDYPVSAGLRSISFMIGPPVDYVQRIPMEWIPVGGSVLTVDIDGRKFGVRRGGPSNGDLEIHDLSGTPQRSGLREIPLNSLIPSAEEATDLIR